MHTEDVAHETLVSWTASSGGDCADHVFPLFDVPMTYVDLFRSEPTATHVVSLAHEIDVNSEPAGMESGLVQVDRFTVDNVVAPPPVAIPAATQVELAEQEIDDNWFTYGCFSTDQVVPF
jgi:hypothetical protein